LYGKYEAMPISKQRLRLFISYMVVEKGQAPN